MFRYYACCYKQSRKNTKIFENALKDVRSLAPQQLGRVRAVNRNLREQANVELIIIRKGLTYEGKIPDEPKLKFLHLVHPFEMIVYYNHWAERKGKIFKKSKSLGIK